MVEVDEEGDSRAHLTLPQLGLDELLVEVQARVSAAVATRDRIHNLLTAVVTVSGNLDLQAVLRRIVETAAELVQARFGALGVLGQDGTLAQFLTVGMAERDITSIGHYPTGLGILGVLIRRPEPLRLDNLSAHPATHGFPSGHPPMGTFLGVPIRVRDAVFGNLYLCEKRGGAQFDAEDETIVMALAAAAGVAIDNARLYDEARRREQWRRASSEVSTALLFGREPEAVLELVADRAKDLSDADVALLCLPAEDGDELVVAAAAGAANLVQTRISRADTVLGNVLAAEGAVAVRNLGLEHPSLPPGILLGAGAAVLVPLGTQASARGVLMVTQAPSRGLFPHDVSEVLLAFAGQAAVALELAERRRDAERLAVFEDRDRIARDLHDQVIQRLFAIGMQLEGASRGDGAGEVTARVRRAVDGLDATIREIRSTIYALQNPPSAEPTSLGSRILQIVDAGAEQLGFVPAVHLIGGGDNRLPAEAEENLLAVLREALSNVVRHASATQVEVRVAVADTVSLTVLDDGVGITGTGRRSGLTNMEQRAMELGGSFLAAAREGGGTELLWEVPLGVDRPH